MKNRFSISQKQTEPSDERMLSWKNASRSERLDTLNYADELGRELGGELVNEFGNSGNGRKRGKSSGELSELAYLWKRWNHTILFYGILLAIFCAWLGLWRYCGSIVGVGHFFRNGFSRDGEFSVKETPRGEFGGQKLVLESDGISYVFRWCPRGNFKMGSPENEKGRKEEEFIHRVTFSSGFWILETETTQEMWDSVMGEERSDDEKEKKLPVCDVLWSEADAFCEKLGRKMEFLVKLPTEAQWEYACRAENSRAFCGGEPDRVAWHQGNSGGKAHPVKKKRGNLWFIYDMHGNAAEWCRDRYDADYYAKSPEKDPAGPEWGRNHVVRGGSFNSEIESCRSAARESQQRVKKAGFRIVLEYAPKKKKKR